MLFRSFLYLYVPDSISYPSLYVFTAASSIAYVSYLRCSISSYRVLSKILSCALLSCPWYVITFNINSLYSLFEWPELFSAFSYLSCQYLSFALSSVFLSSILVCYVSLLVFLVLTICKVVKFSGDYSLLLLVLLYIVVLSSTLLCCLLLYIFSTSCCLHITFHCFL